MPLQVPKLPSAIGAIHPRLSPDGASVAFSYQGGIWVVPRGGGTMTLLSTGEGDDTEPAWSPDGKRIAFVRGGAVKLVEAAGGKEIPLPKPLRHSRHLRREQARVLRRRPTAARGIPHRRQGSRSRVVRPREWSGAAARAGPLLHSIRPLSGRQVDRPHDAAGPGRGAIRQQRLAHGRVEDCRPEAGSPKKCAGSRPASTTCAGRTAAGR